ncbi:MAG: hypothetical protein K5839_00655, partial [Treponemataceae bacterium]|nr:hypothetical protein [Treponemataceae bacterium]
MKKFFTVVLAVLLCAAALVSCGDPDEIITSGSSDNTRPSISLTSSASTIMQGESMTLTVNPSNAALSIVSGSDCASLEGNVLTAIKKGSVTIQAVLDGYESAELTISVDGIGITPSADTVIIKKSISFTLEPSDASLEIVEGSDYASLSDMSLTAASSISKAFEIVTLKASHEDYPDAYYSIAVVKSSYSGLTSSKYWGTFEADGQNLGAWVYNSAKAMKYAVEDYTHIKKVFSNVYWKVEDSSLVQYGYESSEDLSDNNPAAKITFTYTDGTLGIVFDSIPLKNESETYTAASLAAGSAYANEYEDYAHLLETCYEGKIDDIYTIISITSSGFAFTSDSYFKGWTSSDWSYTNS